MEKVIHPAAADNAAAFFSLLNHPVKLKLYLLKNVPAAYFSGVKILSANLVACNTSVPFRWFTKNPFRSTYFACLSMAAELSTGVLAMANVYKRAPAVSLLVTGLEAKFYKKATGVSLFTCGDGDKFREAVEAAVATGSSQEVRAHSVGVNEAGEVIAEFWITWSFKVKGPYSQPTQTGK